ncbi:MAG: TIGR03619 family F420-dependent LLM class oxidoreductase [Gammaproteobacteria bacterium]|nr:TIGR03619 family F420-dependent LLM class oxidoreductase [Gammaproteobacteria bacterium]
MLFSFRPPNADYLGFPATPEGIVATAKRAESLGFDAILVNDHVIVKEALAASWGNTFDPLVTLSYLAACTEKVRLVTSVLIVPLRNPVITAKMIATLDQFSGGRVIVGVGAGWSEPEFAALGAEHANRGAITDEYLDIFKACWSPDPIAYQGRSHQFEEMYCSPKPVQQPHPPFWVGGSSNPALRRAARIAQVWQPVPMALAALQERTAYLRNACERAGREAMPRMRMSLRVNFSEITGKPARDSGGERVTGHGTASEVADDIKRYRDEAGLREFQVNFNGCGSLAQLEASMDRFMGEVRPAVLA